MRLRRTFVAAGTIALALGIITACSDGSGPGNDPLPQEQADPEPADGDDSSAEPEEPSDEGEVVIGELFTDELHDVNIPEPGTGEAVIDGEQLRFNEIDCETGGGVHDTSFRIYAEGERQDGSPSALSISRSVDPEYEWSQEAEEVQIIVTVESEETGETIHPSSLVQQAVAQGEREWMRGEGDLPIIRTDGTVLTAVGVSEADPLHLERGAIEGAFEIAIHFG